ncbi:hypothetical protein LVD13_11165 [Flavobacteriaceae bacterium D16]|nr:hypothetical protein [Flavobacteriaceae bacterium D16]
MKCVLGRSVKDLACRDKLIWNLKYTLVFKWNNGSVDAYMIFSKKDTGTPTQV